MGANVDVLQESPSTTDVVKVQKGNPEVSTALLTMSSSSSALAVPAGLSCTADPLPSDKLFYFMLQSRARLCIVHTQSEEQQKLSSNANSSLHLFCDPKSIDFQDHDEDNDFLKMILQDRLQDSAIFPARAQFDGVTAFGMASNKKSRTRATWLSLAVALALHGGHSSVAGNDAFGALCRQANAARLRLLKKRN